MMLSDLSGAFTWLKEHQNVALVISSIALVLAVLAGPKRKGSGKYSLGFSWPSWPASWTWDGTWKMVRTIAIVLAIFWIREPLAKWLTTPSTRTVIVNNTKLGTGEETVIAPVGEYSTKQVDIPRNCRFSIQPVESSVWVQTPTGRRFKAYPNRVDKRDERLPVNESSFRFRSAGSQPATVRVHWEPL